MTSQAEIRAVRDRVYEIVSRLFPVEVQMAQMQSGVYIRTCRWRRNFCGNIQCAFDPDPEIPQLRKLANLKVRSGHVQLSALGAAIVSTIRIQPKLAARKR